MSTRFHRMSILLALSVLVAAGTAVLARNAPAERPVRTGAPAAAGAAEPADRTRTSAGSTAPVPRLGPLAPTATATATTPTGTSAPPTVVAAPRSTGVSPIPGSPQGWRPIFQEDFAVDARLGSFLATYRNFGAYPWGWQDTSKRGHYDPGILSVSGGTLRMHLHTTSDGVHHVAAPYPRLPGGRDQLYGRYSVRFRADPVDGYKVAWLLWPESEDWSDGEIDFPEGDLTETIKAFMHHVGAPTQQDYYLTGAGFGRWHVATIEWSPGRVVFSFDGRVIGTSTRHVPTKPMHFVLQTETELGSEPVPSTTSGDVQVDWVRIWRYEP